ncbi:MAG: site-2 protease family protein [Anaerolineae bacterium]|nr:site-2 protease family protein [Anaerolineae bacterium]
MSLNEYLPLDDAALPEAEATPDGDSPLFDEVRAIVSSVMLIDEAQELHQDEHYAVAFRGTLHAEPSAAYERLTQALEPRGFTAFLQRDSVSDVILTVQGLTNLDAETGGGPLRRLIRASGRSPGWLHGALLLATIATTVYMGALLLSRTGVSSLGAALAAGGPFALALLLILGVHEMGHYVAARYHKVNVTLPFFIPLPVPGSLGTLGAVIFIRSPLQNRKALFDVGISGPLAGLVVAIPLFIIGLLLSPIDFGAPITLTFRGVGVPVLLNVVGHAFVDGNLSRVILLHPVALAAWFGVLLTALNLLPLGQFDGGHVAYALVGRLAWPLAWLVFGGLIVAGFFFWQTWLLWAFLAGLSGLHHPPPNNDITPLDLRRRILGWVTVVLFLLIVVPEPIVVRDGIFGPSPTDPNAPPPPTVIVPDIPTPTPFILGDSQ